MGQVGRNQPSAAVTTALARVRGTGQGAAPHGQLRDVLAVSRLGVRALRHQGLHLRHHRRRPARLRADVAGSATTQQPSSRPPAQATLPPAPAARPNNTRCPHPAYRTRPCPPPPSPSLHPLACSPPSSPAAPRQRRAGRGGLLSARGHAAAAGPAAGAGRMDAGTGCGATASPSSTLKPCLCTRAPRSCASHPRLWGCLRRQRRQRYVARLHPLRRPAADATSPATGPAARAAPCRPHWRHPDRGASTLLLVPISRLGPRC
jgi:hypothetical protein